jgi:hypothetical protein
MSDDTDAAVHGCVVHVRWKQPCVNENTLDVWTIVLVVSGDDWGKYERPLAGSRWEDYDWWNALRSLVMRAAADGACRISMAMSEVLSGLRSEKLCQASSVMSKASRR